MVTENNKTIINSDCKISLSKAIINCLVLSGPKYKKQINNDKGKVIKKNDDTSQNVIKFISLKGFFFIGAFKLFSLKFTFMSSLTH